MKKTIVVPTDFSSNALAAAQYAITLSEKTGHNVHILHAYMAFHSAFQSKLANQTDEQRAIMGAEKGMQSFLELLGPLAEKPHVTSSGVKADLVEAVNDFTKGKDVELAIMGTRGASGLKMNLLGSNTYDVAKAAITPLLIIPPSAPAADLRNVVFFTDYQAGDEETWKGLISLFGGIFQHCALVHIHEGPTPPTDADQEKLDQWKAQLEDAADFNGLTTELIHAEESVDIVNETLDRLQATFTVLTLVGGRHFFERLTHKSLAKAIIHQPKTPVLLVPNG